METGNVDQIFLSINRLGSNKVGKKLMLTLQRAGFSFSSSILEACDSSLDPGDDLQGWDSDHIDIEIQNSFCSIHFIEKKQLENRNGISMSEYHFNKVREKIKEDPAYKTFIWMPGEYDDSDADKEQLDFINRLQYHLSTNMILSRVPSAIQFVEDVRLILEQQAKKIYDTEQTDVFLIVNQTDVKDAERIQMMLSGIVRLVKLVIVQNSNIDYEEYAAQQMNVSKLSVIYFKNASDWALPFVQQIWKKVGGAAAISPILFISDANAGASNNSVFVAPRVTCFTIPCELIPLEIKMQFDKLNSEEGNN